MGIRIPAKWAVFVCLLAFIFSCKEEKIKEGISDVYIPEVLVFAGDTIPLSDPDIRERLEKELYINTYWHSNTALWVKKSARWFPVIDSVLAAHQIPSDFKYLVPVESSFDNVTSNKGAVGFWQLMEPTAKEFGLIINPEIDERLHVEKASFAACQLLNRGKKVLGNWVSVAASYNIGISGLSSVMEAQFSRNFYDLMINAETGRYLFRILAAKLILENPEKYGFHNLSPYPGKKFTLETVNTGIPNLALWCKKRGLSYKCFRMANPWIKSNSLLMPDSAGALQVAIPTDCRVYDTSPPESFANQTNKADTGNQQPVFDHLVNQKDMRQWKESTQTAKPEILVHEVKQGENLSLIASKYGFTVPELYERNPELKSSKGKIHKGMQLYLPEKAR